MARKEYHYHRCGKCGKVWRHTDEFHGDDLAHTCPTRGCGHQSWGWADLTTARKRSAVTHPRLRNR